MKKLPFLILVIVVLFLLGFIWINHYQNQLHGKIIFRRVIDSEYSDEGKLISVDYQYVLVDFDEGFTQDINLYRGKPAISRDGNFVAGNDLNYKKIILLDISTLQSSRYVDSNPLYFDQITPEVEMTKFSNQKNMTRSIDLPEQCVEVLSEDGGLDSISWSHSDEKLIVNCGSEGAPDYLNVMCILEIKNGADFCWEEYGVINAEYSPTTNEILLSIRNDEIYKIRDDDVENKQFITNGTWASWSPNGNKFVYEFDYEINIYDLNNQSNEIVLGIEENNNTYRFYGLSSFSWSPDGRDVVFQTYRNNKIYYQDIYTLNIKTKEASCISCFNSKIQHNYSPTWGK